MLKTFNRLFLFLSLTVMILLGCSQNKNESVRIGVIAPLTGEVATYGEWFKNSVEIAKDEINQNGGILGKQISLFYEDSQADPRLGITAYKKLTSVHKVKYILGPAASGVSLAISPYAEEDKIVLLTPISSTNKLTDAGDFIFRIAPSDAIQGKIVGKWAFEELNYQNAAVFYLRNEYGTGLKDAFIKNFEGLGGEINLIEGVNENSSDFRTQLLKIRDSNPEFIFLAVYPKEAGFFLKQRSELGINIPVLGTDPLHDRQVLEIAGDAANGVRFTDVSHEEGEMFQEFKKKYVDKYNNDPNIVCAESYDGLKVLVEGINIAGVFDSEAVKNALYTISGYHGASGMIAFDSNGDNDAKSFCKYGIENGNYFLIEE